MSDLLQGKRSGMEWKMRVVPSFWGGYYAYIEVGSTVKVTPERYETVDEAKDAGCCLLADTFAELEA